MFQVIEMCLLCALLSLILFFLSFFIIISLNLFLMIFFSLCINSYNEYKGKRNIFHTHYCEQKPLIRWSPSTTTKSDKNRYNRIHFNNRPDRIKMRTAPDKQNATTNLYANFHLSLSLTHSRHIDEAINIKVCIGFARI